MNKFYLWYLSAKTRLIANKIQFAYVLFFLIIVLILKQKNYVTNNVSMLNNRAPIFLADNIYGDQIDYQKLLNTSSWIVLHFFSTSCATCREEIQEFKDLWEENRSCKNKLCPSIINVSVGDSLDELVAFSKQHALPFAPIIDKDLKISNAYKVMGVPITFIIDKQGVIREQLIGATYRDEILRSLENLSNSQ